jgi:TctA family transporter
MMANLAAAIQLLSSPYLIFIMVITAVYGLFVGLVPGLTATMATALFVPFTFFMDPLPALAGVIVLSAMAIFAGDIPATLVRVPGTPSSSAYVEDAYQLCNKGMAVKALAICACCSATGGIIGALSLMLIAPTLAQFATRFTSFEYFWLAILGLSTTVTVSKGSTVKSCIALLLGLFFSTIGIDITLGIPRFTFGSSELLGGVNFIPAMVGLFGVSEVIRTTEESVSFTAQKLSFGFFEMLKSAWAAMKNRLGILLRSAVLGMVIGALPGAGGDIAAWISYGVGKLSSKHPEEYGKGSEEAVLTATSANNAALGGAWIPALVFGIPGDSITAILLGILMMKGLRPGPLIFERQGDLVYAIYLVFLIANVLLIPLGYLAARSGMQMLKVPKGILMPAILLFCCVGSYAINNSLFDVGVMLVMGLLGYFFEKSDVPVAPIVLGLILGPMVERNFMMSVIKTGGALNQFVTRPISTVLVICVACAWTIPLWSARRRRRSVAS